MAIYCCPLCTARGRDRATVRQHVSQHPDWQNVLGFAKPSPQTLNSTKRKAEVLNDSTKKTHFPRQLDEIPEDDIPRPGNSGSSSQRWKIICIIDYLFCFLFSLNNGEPLITTYNPQPRNTQVVSMPDLQRGDDISEDESIDLDISEDESTDSKRSVLPSQNM